MYWKSEGRETNLELVPPLREDLALRLLLGSSRMTAGHSRSVESIVTLKEEGSSSADSIGVVC